MIQFVDEFGEVVGYLKEKYWLRDRLELPVLALAISKSLTDRLLRRSLRNHDSW